MNTGLIVVVCLLLTVAVTLYVWVVVDMWKSGIFKK